MSLHVWAKDYGPFVDVHVVVGSGMAQLSGELGDALRAHLLTSHGIDLLATDIDNPCQPLREAIADELARAIREEV